MAKVLEFDTFMQEAKGENLTVRVGGKDYSVPPKIPAIVPLMMARAEKLADQSSRVQQDDLHGGGCAVRRKGDDRNL